MTAARVAVAVGLAGCVWGGGVAGGARASDWGFAGPFGRFEPDALGRGFAGFRHDCAGCHGLGRLSYRDLVGAGLDPEGVRGLVRRDGAGSADAAVGGLDGRAAAAPLLVDALPPRADAADATVSFLVRGHDGVAVGRAEARDVVTFLAALARPHLGERHRLGVQALAFLGMLALTIAAARRWARRRGTGVRP